MVSIFDEGLLTTVSAPPGMGKTDFVQLLCYLALRHGYDVLSNIQLDMIGSITEIIVFENKMKNDGNFTLGDGLKELKKSSEVIKLLKHYHLVRNDLEFLNEAIKYKKSVLILDEVNLFSTSKRGMSPDTIMFEMFISAIRKFYCSLIFVIQRYKNFLPMIRELSFCNITKITKQEAMFELYPINKVFTIINIPKSPLRFQTHGFSGWDFVIDWFKLFSDIKNLEDAKVISFLKKESQNGFVKYIRKDI